MNEPSPNMDADRKRLLRGVMLAVFIWGTLLSLGAGLFGIHPERGGVQFAPNPIRGAIVFACVVAFLLMWLLALRARSQRA